MAEGFGPRSVVRCNPSCDSAFPLYQADAAASVASVTKGDAAHRPCTIGWEDGAASQRAVTQRRVAARDLAGPHDRLRTVGDMVSYSPAPSSATAARTWPPGTSSIDSIYLYIKYFTLICVQLVACPPRSFTADCNIFLWTESCVEMSGTVWRTQSQS